MYKILINYKDGSTEVIMAEGYMCNELMPTFIAIKKNNEKSTVFISKSDILRIEIIEIENKPKKEEKETDISCLDCVWRSGNDGFGYCSRINCQLYNYAPCEYFRMGSKEVDCAKIKEADLE